MIHVLDLLNRLSKKGIQLSVDDQMDLIVRGNKKNLDAELVAQIKSSKAEIVPFILAGKNSHLKITPRKQGIADLSYSQQRLWLLDQIDGGSAHYNMPVAIKLIGTPDIGAITKAFETIIDRHESLRTIFLANDRGEPYQVVQSTYTFSLETSDLSASSAEDQALQTASVMNEEALTPFDLSKDLMLRSRLLKLSADEYILLVTVHHIASDGWSVSILMNEFSVLYGAYSQGQENPLPALDIQYADYAHWQRNWLQGDVLEHHLAYWGNQLADLPIVHNLPLDHSRPKTQTFRGAIFSSTLDESITSSLNDVCQSHDATIFMGLHAAFSVLLARYSNETDIVVGSPIANREQAEVANLIGFFVNTLVLRSDLSGNPSFVELLTRSKAMLLDAYSHQQVPFEKIVEKLQPERSLSHSPLFQVMLVFQNNEEGRLDLPGLALEQLGQEGRVAKYDLTLSVALAEQGWILHWEYNTDLFKPSTIAGMADHFNNLLTSLLAMPEENVFKANLLSEAEHHHLLMELNNTDASYPDKKCIHELIEQQVLISPEATAVIFKENSLTYDELNRKSNRLAHYLIGEKKVKPDTLIGVCVERSLDMLIGILAVLKAGAAYVPLDPKYPASRLDYMLSDAKLDILITQSHLLANFASLPENVICLGIPLHKQLELLPDTNVDTAAIGLTSHNLAYLIYTSGSTGQPKGVMIEHKNAVAFLCWATSVFNKSQLDCVLSSTSLCFDLSIFELFSPLTCGGTTLILDSILDLEKRDYRKPLTLINTVPSAADSLLLNNSIPASVKTINLAGEPLKQKMVDQLYDYGIDKVFDLYGPSEDTTYSTYVLREKNGIGSIGVPISNSQIYILNEALSLVPVCVAGELYLGGDGLARGYLNRADLTAEKFIANPFYKFGHCNNSKRIYKTGDKVRLLPSGQLEYLGRIDYQVKIRGFRVELGEIESRLLQHELVEDVIVLAKEKASGDKHLIGYVVCNNDGINKPEVAEELKRYLEQYLPYYMVPAAWVVMDRFPLNQNGKVDRKAFPDPDFSFADKDSRLPTTGTELIIAKIWSKILSIPLDRISADSDFFSLGGDSLSAVRFRAMAEDFSLVVSLSTIFELKTIAKISNEIDSSSDNVEDKIVSSNSTMFDLLPEQKWFFSEGYSNPQHFNVSSFATIDFPLDVDVAQKTIRHLLKIHDALSCSFRSDVNGIQSEIMQMDCELFFEGVDLSSFPQNVQFPEIERICAKKQSQFSISSGPLFCLICFNRGEGVAPLLYYSFNHLICDATSVEIFFDDFIRTYTSIAEGKIGELPNKKYTLPGIVHAIDKAIFNEKFIDRLHYWESLPFNSYEKFRTDFDCLNSDNVISSAKSLNGSLGINNSNILLNAAIEYFGVTLLDVIYLAVSKALKLINDGNCIPVWHIASGRSFIEVNSGISMGKAIGWFSMPSPRFISLTNGENIIQELQRLPKDFKGIPDGGCSYLPMLYSTDVRTNKVSGFPDEDKVVVNHLGIRQSSGDSSKYPDVTIPEDPNNFRSCLFKCVTEVSGGELKISWVYSANQYEDATIQHLINKFISVVVEINDAYLALNP